MRIQPRLDIQNKLLKDGQWVSAWASYARLCRLMCGKALPFRLVSLINVRRLRLRAALEA